MQADVIIVGAGMVGSSLALALKDSGLSILLLDGDKLTVSPFNVQAPFESRVSALSIASQNVLENLGVWPGVLARRVSPYREMLVWDGSGTGQIHFSAVSVHAQVLGHIAENRIVQDALLEQLYQTSVTVLAHSQVENLQRSADGWLLDLKDGSQLRTPLLIAADGANSSVRRLTGCDTREWDYLHHAVVTSVRCEKPHQMTCWQRFTDKGPLAFLPLQHHDGRNWCSIVWSLPPLQAQEVMALDDAAFCAALGQAFEYRLGAIEHANTRLCIPLRQRHAKRYTQQGLAFVGDAAHVIHPLAGQGVNLGFLDVAVLADVLLKAVQRREDYASEQVLSRFERKRMPHNLTMMAAMQGFQHLFQANNLAIRWLRSLGLSQVNTMDELKAVLIRHALGLGIELPLLARARG